MSVIPVERKSGMPSWIWLIGLLVIVAVAWFWMGRADHARVDQTTRSVAAVAETHNSAAASGAAMDPAVSTASITDPGVYAATADKNSLAGRDAALAGAKVVRIVGPKTFTVASGGDELFVVIDPDLNTGVGSQGRIGVGDSVTVKGTFQRLDQQTISDISSRRFRALTAQERDTLKTSQIYLLAMEFGRQP